MPTPGRRRRPRAARRGRDEDDPGGQRHPAREEPVEAIDRWREEGGDAEALGDREAIALKQLPQGPLGEDLEMTLHLVALAEHAQPPAQGNLAARLGAEGLDAEGHQDPVGPRDQVRRRDDQGAARHQHPADLADEIIGIGHMLDDLAGHDDLKGGVRQRQGLGDIAADIVEGALGDVVEDIHAR